MMPPENEDQIILDALKEFMDYLLDHPFNISIVPENEREQNQHEGETGHENPLNSVPPWETP